jgi:hypothetical protein
VKKDWIMDYATGAFVRYASLGMPKRKEYEDHVRQEVYNRLSTLEPKIILAKAEAEISKRKPLLEDIDAVNRVFEMLIENDKEYILEAVRAVYFVAPYTRVSRSVYAARVRSFSMSYPVSEIAVYKWLKSARDLFAMFRGLTIE